MTGRQMSCRHPARQEKIQLPIAEQNFLRVRGLGWRIHCVVEVTESSINKQHIIINSDRSILPQ
jgi:hypothetical protein